MGLWDGKIRFYKEMSSKLPVMLLPELLKLFDGYEYEIEKEVLRKFKTDPAVEGYTPELPSLTLRLYQREAIISALKKKRGIIQIATGGGKAATIIALIKGCRDLSFGKRYLILVPRKQLVEQFFDEFAEVGWIPSQGVGRLYGDNKEGIESYQGIVIATWQTINSLKKSKVWYNKFMSSFDGVIVDEVHTAKAHVLQEIVNGMNCELKIGFTGTMPSDDVNRFTLISTFGPIIWKTLADELIKQKYLSPLFIKRMNVLWEEQSFSGFPEEKKWLEQNPKRNRLIGKLAQIEAKKDHNVLILVEKIKHGTELKELIEQTVADVFFIQGSMPVEQREQIRKKMEVSTGNVIIATYGTFAMGINIRMLHSIIFASPGKSEIRTIQSIGRGLRKSKRKNQLDLFDISDSTKYATRHAIEREKIYRNEQYPYKSYDISAE